MNRFCALTAAITNMRNASQYFDLTNSLLKDIGAGLSNSGRPIYFCKFTKDGNPTQYVLLTKGVREIAEIAGTEVVRGVPNMNTDWNEFISTVYDGIVFYEVEGKDENAV